MKKKNASKKDPLSFILKTPAEIVSHLDQFIIGQEEAKQTLACACYCHLHACAVANASDDKKVWPDNHTLIAGPSGTGKSEMILTLCAFLEIPYFQIDCTLLTPNGYKGRNMDSVISDIEQHFVKSDEITPPCMVIWDEIDKLLDDGSEAGRYHKMTQSDALKVIEGAKLTGNLDASRILHIACGAFVGMEEIRSTAEKPRIGFPISGNLVAKPSENQEPIKAEHFIEFGLIAELVGRFSRFSCMEKLNASDLKDIMLKSKISFLRRKIDQFHKHGTKLVFSDDAIEALAELAFKSPSGARGLRQMISNALAPWDFRLAELLTSGIEEIHYDRASVFDGTKAHVIRNPDPNFQILSATDKHKTHIGTTQDEIIYIF